MPRDDRDGGVDLGRADLGRHVVARRSKTPLALAELDGMLAREVRRARARRRASTRVVQREPGESAVHRAGVEVAEAEPSGERARDRALAGAGRPVDRDDHFASGRRADGPLGHESLLRESVSRSKKPGKAYCRRSRRPRSRRPPASRARRPRRASRCGGRRGSRSVPPRGRVGHAADPEAVLGREHVLPERAQGVDGRLDAVGLLRPQLLGTAQPAVAVRARGGEREERQLVDRERHLAAEHRRRDELGRAHLEVARRARRRCGGGCRPSRGRPSARGSSSRPGAARIEVDAVDVELRARARAWPRR